MTQIERRQARIRRICERLNTNSKSKTTADPETAMSPEARYHIGKTQNEPEHLVHFVQKNTGDPAVKVNFIPMSSVRMGIYIPIIGFHSSTEGAPLTSCFTYAED